MKYIKYYLLGGFLLFMASCSEKALDNINKDVNDPTNVLSTNELPSVIVESAYGTTATDMAWYASLFVEQSTGVDEQFYDADRRNGVTASSFLDNSWNSVYNNLAILKDIIGKCSPGGAESDNTETLGIAQVLTAYNLAVITDMWGQAPWSEALGGAKNLHPKFDKQQQIYDSLFVLLNNAIKNLSMTPSNTEASVLPKQDLIYGGNAALWTKAAWSLKARYFMHMEKIVPSAVDSVLACVGHGFTSGSDALVFSKYVATDIGSNPWWALTYYERGDLCSGKTLYDLMLSRSDPRISAYFTTADPTNPNSTIVPAPNGTADRTRAGYGEYSYSNITGNADDRTSPTPLMSFHELEFLKAEAMARKGVDFKGALQAAIEANFDYHGVSGADLYFTSEVLPRLGVTLSDNLKEIMTQKYIASYEAESLEAYNDYRRTGFPQLNNPNNNLTNYGFVERFPYPSSEVTANTDNVPKVNVFHDKVWWAGGTE